MAFLVVSIIQQLCYLMFLDTAFLDATQNKEEIAPDQSVLLSLVL